MGFWPKTSMPFVMPISLVSAPRLSGIAQNSRIHRAKAAQHCRTPGPVGITERLETRVSVLECGCALPLWFLWKVVFKFIIVLELLSETSFSLQVEINNVSALFVFGALRERAND